MTPFGPAFEALTLADLERFFAEAVLEDRTWEGKRDISNEDLQKQVCAFANADGGHLVLGVDEPRRGQWTLVGWQAKDPDPAVWIDSILAGGALQPRPEWRTRVFKLANEQFVTVTRVEPIAVPPCILRGQVYVRGDARVRREEDVSSLRARFRRGDEVIDRARSEAAGVAERVFTWAREDNETKPTHLEAAIGLAVLRPAEDASTRVFDGSVQRVLYQFMEVPYIRRPSHGVSQREVWDKDSFTWAGPITHPRQQDGYLAARVETSGAVGVYVAERVTDGFIDELLAWWLWGAWTYAVGAQHLLGGTGDYFATVLINGRGLVDARQKFSPLTVERGPISMPALTAGEYRLPPIRQHASEQVTALRSPVLRVLGRPGHERRRDGGAANSELATYDRILPKEGDWTPEETVHKYDLSDFRTERRRVSPSASDD